MSRIVFLAERLPGDSPARPFLEMVFLTSPHLESNPRGVRYGRQTRNLFGPSPHWANDKADGPFDMTIA
jgi:hypothetical protein